MGELRINISNLSEGTHRYSLTTEPTKIGLGGEFQGLVDVEAIVEKTTRQMFLTINLAAPGKFTCDRCLDEFQQSVAGSYRVVFVTDERDAGGGDDEIHVLNPDMNIIELDDDVRQFLELTIPLKLLCREDCSGLCPTCGVNRNHQTCSCAVQEPDTQWDALKKIAKN